MFGFTYVYLHHSLTPLQLLSAVAIGTIIGLSIVYIIVRTIKWKTIYSMTTKRVKISSLKQTWKKRHICVLINILKTLNSLAKFHISKPKWVDLTHTNYVSSCPGAVCEKFNTIVSRQKHKKVLTSLNPFAIITL